MASSSPDSIPFPVQDVSCFSRTNPGSSALKTQVGDELLADGKEHGFLYVKFEPFVSKEDVDAMFGTGKEFFDMSLEEKMKWKIPKDYYTYKPATEKISYKGIGATANDLPLGIEAQDNKEVYNLPRFSSHWHSGKQLPPPLESRRQLIQRFQRGCHDAVVAILDAMSVGLKIGDQVDGVKGERYLSTVAHSWEKPNWTFTRWLHYGLLTLLFQKDVPGLQYRAPNGNWTDVPIVDGCMVVNIADNLQIWTNGYLPSVFHRVVAPPGAKSTQSRLSMTYFSYGDNDCPLEPIPSPLLNQTWPDVYKLHGLDVVLSENSTMGEFTARRSGQNRPGLTGAGTGKEEVQARM